MKKHILIMIMILTVFVAPIKVSALETDYNNGFVQIVAKNNNKQNNNGTDTSQWNDGYNQTQNCSGDNSLLGGSPCTNSKQVIPKDHISVLLS